MEVEVMSQKMQVASRRWKWFLVDSQQGRSHNFMELNTANDSNEFGSKFIARGPEEIAAMPMIFVLGDSEQRDHKCIF